ncbi:NAD-dependent malic enzyme [Thalassotalea sp. 1_MG-2023]|uniref:NAD-dependent malic enzyme n=1 Tax=Thalassotalea sp. 1_MG-2023 TaxID=3062680 RepID=UPI0026E12E80|nr:NAD-dependent malic enzyme [Thalassotalea sp. 1_MG-2023]MDO6427455.1 NAD-dependent malic enzyme [Thalassotalea sp. 1_MG-2023]
MTTNNQRPLYIPYSGPNLLETPLLNKGSAFSREERKQFNLTGLLPPSYETIDEQVERCYMQYSSFRTNLNKHIYLRAIHDKNETLFFKLVQAHLAEMMPIIYTPTVGDACEKFSDIYRSNRGLFISYEDRHDIDDILRNATKNKVKIIVVTDGERILGLGDQGIGGMGIPIGKLSLYTACGGISPAYCLPVMLDVGTNNEKLLNDPMYMGTRKPRIDQQAYDEFVDLFVQAVKRRWPHVMLQFEDFAQPNAMPLLNRYKDQICCFNDDIQGTASVTVGTLLAACRIKGGQLSKQKVVFVGAGSAGCGIAEQIIAQMISEGASPEQARSQVYMIDRHGLVTQGMEGLRDFQEKLGQHKSAIASWKVAGEYATLLETVEQAQPDILIGVSGVAGLFTEDVIKAMTVYNDKPIIFPLSNPVRQVEATPEQVINWTEGKAIVATGSPFEPVEHKGDIFPVAQCNNSYIFPGLGLAVVAANINRITDEMLMVASKTLAQASPLANTGKGELLPPLTEIANLSKEIAFAVAQVAFDQDLALRIDDDALTAKIERNFWQPAYRQYRRCSL